jgi:diguanylate cyclase (GGDEF)-like protein
VTPDPASTSLSRTIASTATLKLAGLHALDLFYTPLEERFERLTRLARRALNVPVAAITVLNHEKQWFKSVNGWMVTELPLDRSLCTWTVKARGPVVIEDTRRDERTVRHALVASAPRFRFYAGVPLADEHGTAAGTFCLFDIKPRRMSADDRQLLADLGSLAQQELLSERLTAAHAALISKLGAARREAMIDPLTRLWNRRGATTLLDAALSTADLNREPVAIAMLDLDNFKYVNDRHGHQVGDEVLRKLGTRLVSAVRADDPVCRLGGDEFMVIMPGADLTTCEQVVNRLMSRLNEGPIPTRAGALPLRMSAGFSVREPGEKLNAELLIERTDRALMRSKSDGRNRIRAAG